MLYQTKETLIRPDWKIVGIFLICVWLVIIGFVLGRLIPSFEDCECDEYQPCHVGFATLEDMSDLSEKLKICEKSTKTRE